MGARSLRQEDADEAEGEDPLGGTVETGVTALVERVMRTEGLLPARAPDTDAAAAEERRVLAVGSPPLIELIEGGCDWGRGSCTEAQRDAGTQRDGLSTVSRRIRIASVIVASPLMRSMAKRPSKVPKDSQAATRLRKRQVQQHRRIAGRSHGTNLPHWSRLDVLPCAPRRHITSIF